MKAAKVKATVPVAQAKAVKGMVLPAELAGLAERPDPEPTTRVVTFGAKGGSEALVLRVEKRAGTSEVELASDALGRGYNSVRIAPLDHTEARPMGTSGGKAALDLGAEGADRVLRKVTFGGFALPEATAALGYAWAGAKSAVPDGVEVGKWSDAWAVLRAGAGAGAMVPAATAPGFGSPGALYDLTLPALSPSLSGKSVSIDVPAVRGRAFELGFASAGDGSPKSPAELSPLAVGMSGAQAVLVAAASGLSFETTGPRPVVLWAHDPALEPGRRAEVVDISTTARVVLQAALDAGGDLALPLTLRARSAGKVELRVFPLLVHLVRPLFEGDPAKLVFRGCPLPLALRPSPGGPPNRVRLRLVGRFGDLRRTAGSEPSPSPNVARGRVVGGDGELAFRLGPEAAEGRPLARLALFGGSAEGELVVELRQDAGGPGPAFAHAAVVPLPARARPDWVSVEFPQPVPLPAGGAWVVVRANRGRLDLAMREEGGDLRISADAGRTWDAAPAGWPSAPVRRLFVSDPGGTAPVVVYSGGRRVIDDLTRPAGGGAPGPAFDLRLHLPVAALAHLAVTAEGAALRWTLDCARDLDLELSDLRLEYLAREIE